MGILEDMRDMLNRIDVNIAKIANSTTPNPPNSKWPNEPKNFKTLVDWDMSNSPNTLVNGDFPIGNTNWRIIGNVPPGTKYGSNADPEFRGTPCGYTLGLNAADAPYSPPECYKFCYPKGMRLGNAPSTVYLTFAPTREIYCAWMCRISDPYDFDNSGQKMAFLFNNSDGQSFIGIAENGLTNYMPEYPDPDPSSPNYYIRWPNRNSGEGLFTPGDWHLVELYTKLPETNDPANSSLKWWIDGILKAEYNDVWHRKPIDMFQFSPTFGGNGDYFKQQDDFFLVDHVRICIPQ